MTCRHRDPINNPECSSYKSPKTQVDDLEESRKELIKKFGLSDEPDNSQFEILDTMEIGPYLLMKMKYESCPKCSYEGIKILAYQGVSMRDVLNWKVIDPHFNDKIPKKKHAPAPIARFPGNDYGWEIAVIFLRALTR